MNNIKSNDAIVKIIRIVFSLHSDGTDKNNNIQLDNKQTKYATFWFPEFDFTQREMHKKKILTFENSNDTLNSQK